MSIELEKEKGQYRFFYHYYKQKDKMSLHFRGTCYYPLDDIVCLVPCETKWNKDQPNLVMQGWATEITIEDNIGIIK